VVGEKHILLTNRKNEFIVLKFFLSEDEVVAQAKRLLKLSGRSSSLSEAV